MSEQEIGHSVVLFDGACSFCNRSVQFILRRDPARRFRFASLQSPVAQRLLAQMGRSLEQLPDSVVLLEQHKVYTRSAAALHIARHLAFPWSLAAVCLLVPAPVRDLAYDWFARNRYRWFGKQPSCLLPTSEMQSRFLTE
jgi:predicted DCC family thiol-disulfide oxidoreductase YuxK